VWRAQNLGASRTARTSDPYEERDSRRVVDRYHSLAATANSSAGVPEALSRPEARRYVGTGADVTRDRR